MSPKYQYFNEAAKYDFNKAAKERSRGTSLMLRRFRESHPIPLRDVASNSSRRK